MKQKFSRRTFLKAGLIASGGAAALLTGLIKGSNANGQSSLSPEAFLSHVMRYEPSEEPPVTPPGGSGSVVQVRADDATNWNFSAEDYWNYVNQAAIDRMTERGIKALTGQATLASAWRSLLPNYRSGEIVAIKVSFNNSERPEGSEHSLDAIAEPINSIITGLKAAGVPGSSIVIFDSSRYVPARFRDKIQDRNVKIKDKRDTPWGSGSQAITFRPPASSQVSMVISNVVVSAKYLINVPIIKRHGFAGLSNGLKNHYGTIEDPESIHPWTSLASDRFSTSYSPIVELNANANIGRKTILVVGDAIFGSPSHNAPDRSFPTPWRTFGNDAPKSLLFSRDPVAIDSIMGELVSYERIARGGGPIDPDAFAHLQLAERAGLGIFERGDPWRNPYKRIKYTKFDV